MNSPEPSKISPSSTAGIGESEYLSLRLGTEEYIIGILQVQEIRSYEEPTRMVNAPMFVKGVINLRGVIVPIVDMRLKLGLPDAEYNDFTVVIVLRVHGTVIGVVVDAVSDVVSVRADTIKPAPQFQTMVDSRFITGLVTQGERTLIVMNIQALLDPSELGMNH
ncbi:chemotaxis protein CheW [Candidatus Symbiobacter mobilis]|uniref:Chemotaxis protein CheW n=1 Tax=Candidatus Symbiobacter mobilis CR TaxID=946483 RepID=U5N4R6_9BURK|nr:chemotaxis protein CheW [Candidatus Symbiobacter mobilis]AGX86486.1 chemotaxis protein CheW [Candidatus Symbiobacter mobilis CR]